MNLAQTLLSKGVESSEAIRYRGRTVTYGELRADVERLASELLARGLLKGERVGIFCENSPFFVTAYLGIIRACLVAVPFQTEMSARTFVEIITKADIKHLFVSRLFQKRIGPWAEQLELSMCSEGDLPTANPRCSFPEIDACLDLAALMFTSGSTGAPKAVMVSHRNIECNTVDIISYLGIGASDKAMVVLPFHYCFGLSLLHTHLAAGASVVLNNEFRLYPEAVLDEMQQTSCTGFAGVPSTYQILLRRSRFRSMAFPHLRCFQQAGGKLPNACIREILDSFPAVKFFLMYGQTEATARLSYLLPDRLADKAGSIGKGLPSTLLEVLKADGTPVTPGSDEIGEIVAAGDNVTRGYWNDSIESSKFFRSGRLYTGDLAQVDADGFIFIVDREREFIKSGGNRVSAKEIEDVIFELPQVVEVAVLGAQHDLLGEAIKALVVPTPEARLTSQDVIVHCRRRLPAFKVPEEVIFVSSMIHNSAGKILKSQLRRRLDHRSHFETKAELFPQREHSTV
jgi:long-chain acyl-CoA synthetase